MYQFRNYPQNEMVMSMPMNQGNLQSQPMFNFEPYVYETLRSVIGKVLIVSTVRDTLRGKLMDVKPDHVVLNIGDETFFVHTCQIVSVMPD
ncbi:YuzF family protein [Rossellomorea vietnamensis]|uniref:YuzF family protein n=1 Tax=Rossellomorea vietnamensis TaxID=218284 RepID=UPI003CFB0FE5